MYNKIIMDYIWSFDCFNSIKLIVSFGTVETDASECGRTPLNV